MKSFVKICSIILITYTSCIGQKIVMTDLSYVISKEDERSILLHSQSEGKYIMEILTPRRYISQHNIEQPVQFSDLLLFYDPNAQSPDLEIYVLSDELQSDEFEAFITSLQTRINTDYFSKNMKLEGFEIAVKEIISFLQKCSLHVTVLDGDDFTPAIDNDVLEIEFATECQSYKFFKVEIFSKSKSEVVYQEEKSIQDIPDNKFRWDGKVEGLDYKYIRSLDAPITIRISLSTDVDFKSFVVGSVTVEIDKTVDEWNQHKSFFDGYVVTGEFPGSKYQFYKQELREMMINSIPSEQLPDDKSPLQYMHENLITVTFLGKRMLTHKKFAEKLAGVDERLKSQGYFNELQSTYQPLVNGSFALRKIAKRDLMSPHSLAVAVDIDPDHNPHIKDVWGKQVFNVINFVTGVNMYNTQPDVMDMKMANSTFKKNFSEAYMSKIEKQSEVTEVSVMGIENKIKYQGEFDEVYDNLYANISETYRLYLEVEPSVTDEERKREAEYLDRIRGLKTQVGLHEETIKNYFNSLPNFEFIPHLESKFNSDRTILEEKGRALLFYNASTNYVELNSRHRENQVNDIITLFNKEQVSKLGSLNTDMNAQKPRLLTMAARGFFELDERIVNAFINEPGTRWGGAYLREKDFMHFELYPLTSNLE